MVQTHEAVSLRWIMAGNIASKESAVGCGPDAFLTVRLTSLVAYPRYFCRSSFSPGTGIEAGRQPRNSFTSFAAASGVRQS